MPKFFVFFIIAFIFSGAVLAQQTNEKPAWNVTLESDRTARSNITVQNRCKKTHNFEIKLQNISFLEIEQTEVKVKGGKDKIVPVMFNTTGLTPRIYEGTVLVICLSCSKEPTCTQDRETLPVVLKIPGNSNANPAADQIKTSTSTAASNESIDPCEKLRKNCDKLLRIAENKETEADAKQTAADNARDAFNKADTAAKDLEKAAGDAEELADIKPPTGRGSVDGGQEYTTADSAYLEQMNAQVNADYQSGKISVEEHQKRLKENTIEKARKERIKNEARLKKEAKEARDKADKARAEADKAKAAADAAQNEADKAKAEAEKARKAYEDCIKKAEDECEKIKKQIEEKRLQAEAEKKKKEEAEAKTAAEERRKKETAERNAAAEANRLKAADAARKKQRERTEYLVNNIKTLGLINSRGFDSDVPGVWQWLPDFLETPVSMLVEKKVNAPIPLDTLRAIGGLYGIAASLLDPCTALGMRKTVERLEEMTNPYTKAKYTNNQALDKTRDMCTLLRRLKAKLEAYNKAQGNK